MYILHQTKNIQKSQFRINEKLAFCEKAQSH